MRRRIVTALIAVIALLTGPLVTSPASATTLATVNHDTNFDPHAEWSGEEDANGAVAMNDAGTVAVFMRPFTDATNCSGTPAAAMEIYVGLVGATSTRWQPPVTQSTFALPGGCANIRDFQKIILNPAGTAGYALMASTISAVDLSRITSEWVISFTIDASGVAHITNHFGLGVCSSTEGCVNPFYFNLHLSAKTGDVFASVMNFRSSPYSSSVTDVAYFNSRSSSWTHASLPGLQGLTSGISRDGTMTYVAGPEYVGDATTPANLAINFCKGAFSPDCIGRKVTWVELGQAVTFMDSSLSDAGSTLVLGWASYAHTAATLSVAAIPLRPADQGGAIAVSAHQMPSDRVRALMSPFQVFINPTGTKVWAVMTSSTDNSELVSTGSVTGGSIAWGALGGRTVPGEHQGAWKAALTRGGRLVIARANANTQILVADRADTSATWFATEIPQGRQRYTSIESLAMNASGSRWVMAGLVSTAVQPIAAVGVFKAIPVAKKAPTITGSARIGAKLTAHLGTWNVTRGTSTYQWMRDGVAINSATSSTYTTVPLDSGRKITVQVTYTKAGYFTRTATSAAKKMPGTIRYCSLSVIGTAC